MELLGIVACNLLCQRLFPSVALANTVIGTEI
jgi:hypothetical protein